MVADSTVQASDATELESHDMTSDENKMTENMVASDQRSSKTSDETAGKKRHSASKVLLQRNGLIKNGNDKGDRESPSNSSGMKDELVLSLSDDEGYAKRSPPVSETTEKEATNSNCSGVTAPGDAKDSEKSNNVEVKVAPKRHADEGNGEAAKRPKLNGVANAELKSETDKVASELLCKEDMKDVVSPERTIVYTEKSLQKLLLNKIVELFQGRTEFSVVKQRCLKLEKLVNTYKLKIATLEGQLKEATKIMEKTLEEQKNNAKERSAPTRIVRNAITQTPIMATARNNPGGMHPLARQNMAIPQQLVIKDSRVIQAKPTTFTHRPGGVVARPVSASQLPAQKAQVVGSKRGPMVRVPVQGSLLRPVATSAANRPKPATPAQAKALGVIDLTNEDEAAKSRAPQIATTVKQSPGAVIPNAIPVRVVNPQQLRVQNGTTFVSTSQGRPQQRFAYIVQSPNGSTATTQPILVSSASPNVRPVMGQMAVRKAAPGQNAPMQTFLVKGVVPGSSPSTGAQQATSVARGTPNSVQSMVNNVNSPATTNLIRTLQPGTTIHPVKVANTVMASASTTKVSSSLSVTSVHPAPLPLPPVNQATNPSWKAMPPKPELTITEEKNGTTLSWNMTLTASHSNIASYQLYAYQESAAPPRSSQWKKVGDVKALALPMACTLTQFMKGHKYHFAVRAIDVHSRVGPFSNTGSIVLLNDQSVMKS